MGKHLAVRSSAAASTFDEASDELGFDVRELMWDASAQELTRTENAQPAIIVLAVAAFRAWLQTTKTNGAIEWAAGHSIGGIGAAIVVGALTFGDGVRLARERGELMSRAPGDGAMLAVAVTSEGVREQANELARTLGLDIACRNGPRQVVLSGATSRVREAQTRLGARSRLLDVSHGFHSALMDSVADDWTACVSRVDFQKPNAPMLSSVSGRLLLSAAEIAADIRAGVRETVRWDLVTTVADTTQGEAVILGNGAGLARMWRGTAAAAHITIVDDAYRGGSHST